MLRKRKFIFATLVVLCTFLFIVAYLMNILTKKQTERLLTNSIVEEKIKEYLNKLPDKYKVKNKFIGNITDLHIENVHHAPKNVDILIKLWHEVNSWVSKGVFVNTSTISNLGSILGALKYTKIIYADLDTRGTQLKLLLTLEASIYYPSFI